MGKPPQEASESDGRSDAARAAGKVAFFGQFPEELALPFENRRPGPEGRSNREAPADGSSDGSPPQPAGPLFQEDLLLGVRFRAARNLKGVLYPTYLNPEQGRTLAGLLLGEKGPFHVNLGADLGPAVFAGGGDLGRLKNRGLLPEAAEYALVYPERNISLYTGDEDHVRLQFFLARATEREFLADLQEAFLLLERLDELYDWQFHPVYGMQTACPANSGGGLRLSFRLALPEIQRAGLLPAWERRLQAAGAEIRGAGGEGTRVQAGLLQISNRSWPLDVAADRTIQGLLALLARMARKELELRVKSPGKKSRNSGSSG